MSNADRVTLWTLIYSQDLPEATRIVLAALDECRAAAIKLEKVELDPELCRETRRQGTSDELTVSNANLQCEARFFRV